MAKRLKIPKRVAGVKIPKAIRKGPIMDFVNSSGGQVLLSQALLAAVSLFAAKQINHEGASETLSHPVDSLQRAGRRVKEHGGTATIDLHRNTARLQFALGEAVRAFREALADPASVSAVGEPEGDAGKKKYSSPPSETAPH